MPDISIIAIVNKDNVTIVSNIVFTCEFIDCFANLMFDNSGEGMATLQFLQRKGKCKLYKKICSIAFAFSLISSHSNAATLS